MNARTSSQSETRNQQIAEVIFRHAAAISRQTDVASIVALNADLARDLLGADRCSLWLLDAKRGELWTRVSHGIDEIRIPAGTGLVGACVDRNETLLINDVQSDPRFHRIVDRNSGYVSHSTLCVPLEIEGIPVGAMQALNKPGGFIEEDAEILRFMTIYSAAAIHSEQLRQTAENARLLTRELDIASSVQQRLLPQLSEGLNAVEVYGFCRPARNVGGDYFDHLSKQDGSLAITVGDVSGKGFPAAVLMASIYTLLRHLLLNSNGSIAELISECNRTVYASSATERYSTLFCGVLNPSRTTLRYVNAGQISPYLLRHNKSRAESLYGGDVPLGLLQESVYTERLVALEPGDLLLCLSDGLVEVENSDGDFWEPEAIPSILEENRHHTCRRIAEALITAADNFAVNCPQFDDMTVLVIRILPFSTSATAECVHTTSVSKARLKSAPATDTSL